MDKIDEKNKNSYEFFKIFNMQNSKDKAQSQLITIVLIILLSLISVIILFNLVNYILSNFSDNVDTSLIDVNLEIKDVYNNLSDGCLYITIYRGSGDGDIYSLIFLLNDNKEKQYRFDYVFPEDFSHNPLETFTYKICDVQGLDSFDDILKVSVAYQGLLLSGKKVTKPIQDELVDVNSESPVMSSKKNDFSVDNSGGSASAPSGSGDVPTPTPNPNPELRCDDGCFLHSSSFIFPNGDSVLNSVELMEPLNLIFFGTDCVDVLNYTIYNDTGVYLTGQFIPEFSDGILKTVRWFAGFKNDNTAEPGSYSVSVMRADGSCETSLSEKISVVDLSSELRFRVYSSGGCFGKNVNYKIFKNNELFLEDNFVPTEDSGTIYYYQLNVEDGDYTFELFSSDSGCNSALSGKLTTSYRCESKFIGFNTTYARVGDTVRMDLYTLNSSRCWEVPFEFAYQIMDHNLLYQSYPSVMNAVFHDSLEWTPTEEGAYLLTTDFGRYDRYSEEHLIVDDFSYSVNSLQCSEVGTNFCDGNKKYDCLFESGSLTEQNVVDCSVNGEICKDGVGCVKDRIYVSECGVLDKPNTVYVLKNNLVEQDPDSPCIVIHADGITLFGDGYSIYSSIPGKKDKSSAVQVNADNVILSDLEIFADNECINIGDVDGLIIRNSNISNSLTGIYFSGFNVKNVDIYNVYFRFIKDVSIDADSVENLKIYDSYFISSENGAIIVTGSKNVEIYMNKIFYTFRGISVIDSDAVIYNNSILGWGKDVKVDQDFDINSGIYLNNNQLLSFVQIIEDNFIEYFNYGFYVSYANGDFFKNNTLKNNNYDLYVEYGNHLNGNTFRENDFCSDTPTVIHCEIDQNFGNTNKCRQNKNICGGTCISSMSCES